MSLRAAVILAAGQGTRMRSAVPKVLHKVAGKAMLDWSISLAESVGCEDIFVVCSPSGAAVQEYVTERLGAQAVIIQEPALGTGHAVRCAAPALAQYSGDVVVLYGDTPLIPPSAVEDLFGQLADGAAVGVLGFDAERPGAYGRLVTDDTGALEAIVEAKEATEQELAITLCNSGVMAAPTSQMFSLLENVTNENAKQEYYLTDIVGLARKAGLQCAAVKCAEDEVLGVNSRLELAAAEAVFQAKRRQELLLSGVTMTAPETVFLSHDTQIAPDVEIEPHVVFGPGVEVQPGARIRAFSHLEGAKIGPGCEVGPYARLRPGAVLESKVKIGNFVEVKNTTLHRAAKANHLAYLGDGEVGAEANIGAGTIFCNYDGFLKHKTKVGARAFIGSNSALVAPVEIGDGAIIGSGSVITKSVASNSLAVGRARQIERSDWATSFRDRMSAIKAARAKN